MTATTPNNLSEATLSVDGMDCASCVAHVEKTASKIAGVEACSVNLAMGKAVVKFNPAQTDADKIADAITRGGYPAAPQNERTSAVEIEDARLRRQHDEARAWFWRWVLGFVLWLPTELHHAIMYFVRGHQHPAVDWMTWVSVATGTIAIVFIGSAFFRSAFKSLRAGTTNMDVLISMGAGTAYVYSLIALIGHLTRGWPLPHLYFMESAGLLALISLGHWLESRARESAGSAIRKLMNLAPTTARKISGLNEEQEVSVSSLRVGDRVIVKPGDRIPIDGTVYAGHSSVDESMITGESIPVPRKAGDAIIGGTINIDGALRINVSATGSATALAQIVKLVEDAQTSKPAVQKLADRISAVFVPAVLGIAVLTGIGWYIYGSSTNMPAPQLWGKLANAVCSVLIIACPCALGLAVPAAVMVGTGRGAQRGILIRDIDALQNAEKIDTVVLDKTGTLTLGRPVVRNVTIDPSSDGQLSEDQMLALAAGAEANSSHPLAKAIVEAAKERGLTIPAAESFSNLPGLGVRAIVNGQNVLVGTADLLIAEKIIDADFGKSMEATADGDSMAMIAIDGKFVGDISIGDSLKPDSIRAIELIHALGLKTMLLSGDNESSVSAAAATTQIHSHRAKVKPADKAQVIRELQRAESSLATRNPQLATRVAMVGDGINDAPALAAADLGIAIGSGSDIAKEAGDIVLVSGSLTGVPAAIRLSRATMKKIRQNLFFAFIYNVLAIPLAAFGLLNPMIAAGAMALSDVTVIGNALLLKRTKID